jgi:hypothetical protein
VLHSCLECTHYWSNVLKSAHFCGIDGAAPGGEGMQSRKKISVVLQVNLFQRFNTYCANQGYKKSPLIARLIREHMDEESISGTVKRDSNRIDRPIKKR